MAARKSTKQRILDTSLALFNAEGEPNVSTNHVADEMDISPGNLYYHYRNKEDIVEALYEQFERLMDEQIIVPTVDDAPSIENLWFYLHLMFESVGEYRFLYRDLVNIASRYGSVARKFRRLLRRQRESFEAICLSLHHSQVMHTPATEIPALSANMLLVMTYWFNFALINGQEEDPTEAVFQELSLLAPHLEPQSRLAVQAIALRYR